MALAQHFSLATRNVTQINCEDHYIYKLQHLILSAQTNESMLYLEEGCWC